MNKKVPFTPDGMQDLQAEIYQLPQTERMATANVLYHDYKTWMIDHFDFTPPQLVFLQEMDDLRARYYGAISAHALENMLPILLIKTAIDKARVSDPPIWKIVRSEDIVEGTADNARLNKTLPPTTGSLTFIIRYSD